MQSLVQPTLCLSRIGIDLIVAVSLVTALCPQWAKAQQREGPTITGVKWPATVSASIVPIQSPVDGVVQQVLVQEGERVQRGQVLFRLDTRRLEAQLNLARAHLQAAKADYARVQRLKETKVAAEEELARAAAAVTAAQSEVQSAEVELDDRILRAPCNGALGELNLVAGQVVSRGTTLVSLVIPEPLKVEWRVPGNEVGQFQIGQKFQLHVEATADERFIGSITFIAPAVDTSTRTCTVKGLLPGGGGGIRPGMSGWVTVVSQEKDKP